MKRIYPAIIIGITAAVLLGGAAVWRGTITYDAWQAHEVELATTYTPAPTAGNVMKITPDPSIPVAIVLRTGSKGPAVIQLQERLAEMGYYLGEADGQYGIITKEAVSAFQRANGLDADGIFGSASQAVLYSETCLPASAATPVPTSAPSPVPTATPSPTPVPTPEPTEEPYQEPSDEQDSEDLWLVTDDDEPEEPQETVEITISAPWVVSDGMPLLVNSSHALPDGYQPTKLVNLTDYCDPSVVKIKANGIEGEQVAVDALIVMLKAAQADGLSNWQVSACYRSVEYQKKLFDNKVYELRKEKGYSGTQARNAVKKTTAEPSHSEHHLGLAFDITVPGTSFGSTKQSAWIAEHCWEYGFILRYASDKTAITGISNEPWHFRYVGTEHSLIMCDENLCLEEYIEKYGTVQ